MIPQQLCNPDFRFVKIKAGEKRPYEVGWTTTKNYAYNDAELLKHIMDGGNYGVVCGPGGLRVLDADEPRLYEKLNGSLPKTFRVKTGRGGTHDYYICEGIRKIVLDDGEHLGELQGPGTQVVGPQSTHPNGNKYEVVQDIPIMNVEKEDMYTAFKGIIKKENKGKTNSMPVYSTIHLNISDVVNGNLRRRGDEYQGEHPIHGSEGGANFCVNPGKNVWHCFRCESGGGPLEWIAVQEGLIDCSQAGKGSLGGEKFKQVLQIAREKYGYMDPLDELEKNKGNNKFNYPEYKELFLAERSADARYHLAEQIVKSHYLKTHEESNVVYSFNGKYYAQQGDIVVKQELQRCFKEIASTNNAREVMGHVQRSTFTPEENFDRPTNWLCLDNGVLDIDTGEFAPHTPEFVSRNILPLTYDPECKCNNIVEFLNEIISPEDITIIQELVGYFLLKEYPYQKAFMFLGGGANGKSTLINLFQEFLGRNNISNVSLQDLGQNKFAAAQLVGKMANLYPDLPKKTIKYSGMFKVLTGGDYVSVEKKFKDGFSYKNYAKLVFSCNELPASEDDSDAFFRRWIFINFPNKFEGKKADKNKLKKITTKEEMSGLLNWALEGLKRLRENGGFSSNTSTDEMRETYNKLSSPIGAFVSAELEPSPYNFVTKDDMYEEFVEFCERCNLPSISKDKFAKSVSQYAKRIRTSRRMINGQQIWCWDGYRLLSAEQKNHSGDGKSMGYQEGLDIEEIEV